MNSLTVLRYLFGHAGAIRRVASSPMAVPVGILLVFSAAVARNYDQVWFGETPGRLLLPLLFSIGSGTWLLFFVWNAWARRTGDTVEPGPGEGRVILSFFGCFWMTAPIAWLYAIPVERWCDPVEAARWNLRLLAVVSLWRVLLMGRVVAVIGRWPFWKGLGVVLLPASLETLAISFLNAGFGRKLMAAMGGLRNSPAEDVMYSAFQVAVGLSIAAFVLAVALCGTFGFKQRPGAAVWRPEPSVRWWQTPWILLALTGAFWTWASMKPQEELERTRRAQELAQEQNWNGLVAFLSQHRKEDFAPAVILPPDPWHSSTEIIEVFKHITPQTPAWVRETYFHHLEALMVQPFWYRGFEQETFTVMLASIEELEGGRAFLQRCASQLEVEMRPENHRKGPGFSKEMIEQVLKYSNAP